MADKKYLNHKMSPFHFGQRKTDVLRTSCALSRKVNCYDNCIMETFFGRLNPAKGGSSLKGAELSSGL